jgi:pimeloyl-ACP methyl ester carboxylesterase
LKAPKLISNCLASSLCLAGLFFLDFWNSVRAAPVPIGFSQLQAGPAANALTVYTYKPQNYSNAPLVVVFHGMLRNAADYCRFAKPLADRYHVLIAAPLFSTNGFSNDAYSRGGVISHGVVQSPEKWTYAHIPGIVSALRNREGHPLLPYYFLGHSAGAQFLMRLAALHPTEAIRIVAANPGTDLYPRRDWDFPFGFGKLPASLSSDARLQRYLAAPLTIYLGTEDNNPNHPELDRSEAAEREGPSRLDRGRGCFVYAQHLARERGWKFNWRKVEVVGIGHDAENMFAMPALGEALFGSM